MFYIAGEQGTEARLPRQEAAVAPGPCRVTDRTHGGSMARENRLDRVVSTRGLRVSVRKGHRPPMRLAPPSVRRPLAPSSTTAEPVTLARVVAEVRLALEVAAVATAEAAARASSVADALAALSGEESPVLLGSSPTPGPAAGLSQREREVLALVAVGQTNKAIAEALYVSPNTVKTHVTLVAAQAAGRLPCPAGRDCHQAGTAIAP